MNINQLQICLDNINEIQKLDLSQKVFDAHVDERDLSKITFSIYSASKLIELLDKTMTQLSFELTDGLGLLLPNAENYQNDFGAINLTNELPQIKSHIEGNHFTHLETLLDKFIHYQIKNGFWDKSKIEVSKIERKELNSQHKLIAKNLDALNENLSVFDDLKDDFRNEVEKIITIIESKNVELNSIAQNLQTSTSQTNEITSLLSDVSNKDTEISGILKNVLDKIQTVETDIGSYQESFNIIETN